jgi:hypothetical protein
MRTRIAKKYTIAGGDRSQGERGTRGLRAGHGLGSGCGTGTNAGLHEKVRLPDRAIRRGSFPV